MVIKNLENKIKLVGIICTAFLIGCILISVSSIWTARTMVTDAQKKVYVLDGNVPILVNRTTMEETLDVEAKSHVEMFHHYFFTLMMRSHLFSWGHGVTCGGRAWSSCFSYLTPFCPSSMLLLLSRFSRVRLCATLWTIAHQASLSMGFPRQEPWSGLPCPPAGDLPDSGIEPGSPAS